MADPDAGAGVDDLRRLLRERADAAEQLTATNEILTALGRSADPDAVLDTIVSSGRRLCRADAAQVYLADGDHFVLAASVGLTPEFIEHLTRHPLRRDRANLVGRATLDRTVVQVPDVLSDPKYGRPDVQQLSGLRTSISAPMLVEGVVVGTLSLFRTQVDPFDERAIALLEALAAQAAVVVRTVDLVRALEGRQAELSRRVQQLESLSEVSQTVSSSLVLDEVLATVIANAVRLSGCDGGSIMEYLEEEGKFVVRAAHATDPALLERLRSASIGLHSTLVGRAAREGRPIAVPDLAAVEADPHLEVLRDGGWRSMVAVPMLRGGAILGALVVRRRIPGDFTPEMLEFVETFAGQSALAVYNAKLFRELERRTAELQVASQHKSDFLASMSHELRTPLNAVIGFSEVLLDRLFGELNERQDEYLRDILSSGRHLLELLNEILDLSKVEAGRMELEPSTFAVRTVLEDGLSMVRERAGQHGITLELVVGDDVDLVVADVLRFKQVLLNLLSNAVKFTGDGGRVRVDVEHVGDDLEVRVTDSGPGIRAEDRERIFESFQQGHRGVREEGTGLGLTLCRRIVALLGGRMWLDSELGVGSIFGFTLPVGGDPAPGAAGDGESALLLVEDDRASLDLLAVYLDRPGVRLVRARDGREALDLVRRLVPSAVVLDIQLPGVDGWEVLEQLRSDPATAGVPVVVVSILDERARGLALGAADYLVKPVRRDELVGTLVRIGALPRSAADVPRPAARLRAGAAG
ncbi:GAF domain-containing protein [Friedmanniella luteola]|uniref:histidine kinase n=1 Tax=Friedmanniella luteola TaxID=546871 RepID=A0A1H1XKE2_9ACTN|nr:GAF domain-containing protein [Friedmanniella luteola]SDT09289.1 GAF domain-containing protein [Friedmanniella luteola]